MILEDFFGELIRQIRLDINERPCTPLPKLGWSRLVTSCLCLVLLRFIERRNGSTLPVILACLTRDFTTVFRNGHLCGAVVTTVDFRHLPHSDELMSPVARNGRNMFVGLQNTGDRAKQQKAIV